MPPHFEEGEPLQDQVVRDRRIHLVRLSFLVVAQRNRVGKADGLTDNPHQHPAKRSKPQAVLALAGISTVRSTQQASRIERSMTSATFEGHLPLDIVAIADLVWERSAAILLIFW